MSEGWGVFDRGTMFDDDSLLMIQDASAVLSGNPELHAYSGDRLHETMLMELGTAEEARLEALHRYNVLDTEPEESFDRITRLAKILLQTPIAFVSLIDRDRQWFKSRQGLRLCETPRSESFCTIAIQSDVPLIVPDASKDSRFESNPHVVAEHGIRFYLGVPLRTPDGHNIGTLCVADMTPRTPTREQLAAMQDLARLVVDEMELRQLATIDCLTGAMSRGSFLNEARHGFRSAVRARAPLSVVMLDIDHFKSINDRYGHAAGDAVLRQVIEVCQANLRQDDVVGRLGGEEFGLVLPNTALEGAAGIAERLRREVEQTTIRFADRTLTVTASFGVAASEGAGDIDMLIVAADEALYRAKAAGRNRVSE
jgi:diguanylate cyclase (GGDEF)-like protein